MKSKAKFHFINALLLFAMLMSILSPISILQVGATGTETTIFTGHSLTLDDKIGVNFFVNLPEGANDNDYVRFTVNNKTLDVKVKDATKNTDGTHVFTCPVVAKEMADTITAELFIGGTPLPEKSTKSVVDYANSILNDKTGTYTFQTKVLIKAMLKYGAATQTQFNHNTGALADNGIGDLPGSADIEKLTNGFNRTVSGAVDGIKYYGSTLVLLSETTIRHYFTATEDIKNFKFELVKRGETTVKEVLEPVAKGDKYYVEIKGISPASLDKNFVLNVTKAGDTPTLTVTYSPYAYINRMKTNEQVKALLTPLVNYAESAEIYKNANQEIIYADNIKVDGIKETAYDSSLVLKTKHEIRREDENAQGDATAWFTFDRTGLYVYAEVKDSTLTLSDTGLTGDKFQVYVDFVNDHEKSGYTGNDYRFQNRDLAPTCEPGKNPGGNWKGDSNKLGSFDISGKGSTYFNHGFWSAGDSGYATSSFKTIEGGYATEIFFPFPYDMRNMKIGIGIQCQDNSNDKTNQTDAEGKITDPFDVVKYDTFYGEKYWSNYEYLPDYYLGKAPNPDAIINVEGDLQVDGQKDTEYSEFSTLFTANIPYSGSSEGHNNDGKSKAWIANNGKGIYIYAEVNDSTLNRSDDKIQFYIDFANDRKIATGLYDGSYNASVGKKYGTGHVGHIEFFGTSSFKQSGGLMPLNISHVAKEIPNGYAVECFIPFPANVNKNEIRIGLQSQDNNGTNTCNYYDTILGTGYWKYYNTLTPLTLNGSNIVAPPVKELPTIEYVAPDTITVDGQKDAAYTNVTSEANWCWYSQWCNTPMAKSYALHDGKGLYVYVEVYDTVFNGYDRVILDIDFLRNFKEENNDYFGTYGSKYMEQATQGNGKIGQIGMWRNYGAYTSGGNIVYPGFDGTTGILSGYKEAADHSNWSCEFYIPFPENKVPEEIGLILEAWDSDGTGTTHNHGLEERIYDNPNGYIQGRGDIATTGYTHLNGYKLAKSK